MVAAAEWGWRGRLNRWTFGMARVPATREERAYRVGQVQVLRAFAAPQQVVVANPKGGAGKTPVTLGLAATLGWFRGGYTLAWDNNETRGTLGLRAEEAVHERNVVDLLKSIDGFLNARASVGHLGGFVRPQSAHFDVLASDDVPGRMDVIDAAGFHQLADVLGRFYRFMVIDTGNNVRAANWWAATSSADCLVVPTTVRADVAETGLWMLHHLARLGRTDLVRGAVAVVSCADPKVDHGLLTAIVERYREVVREVVVLPFDPRLSAGDRVTYRDLGEPLRRALLMAAVAVVDALSAAQQQKGA
ncbi:MinD-like ATPase involved in chromosome partitioning or flagellar assembly [Micromonospora nigra]|uniref:MinD-like ATPase involved in chromosome partitioning or flagellar assembly n=1 Tax=Micromonospora nigra TaxID=145857 RepID=A0A1C6R7F0_9ACTN|nr:MinD-like ATPase involved in chromosome partitioning or flagellar assembly [Micromonospora nigra]